MSNLRRLGPAPRFILVAFALAAVLFFGTAYVKKGVGARGGGSDTLVSGYFKVGNFWMKIWNRQYVGDQNGDTAGEWPGGSGVNYTYIGNHWFGCLKDGVIHVSGNFPYYGVEWDEVGGITETEILWSNKSNWANRPEYVKTYGDLDSYTWCDDGNASEAGPIPVTYEMHGMQWSAPGHYDWLVFENWLTNKHTGKLTDCYFMLAYDQDVGGSLDYIDDLVGIDGNDTYDEWTNPTLPGVPWTEKTPDGIPDEYDFVNFGPHTKYFNGPEYAKGRKREAFYMYDSGGEARNTPGYIALRVMGWTAEPAGENLIEMSASHSWDIMNDPDTDAYKYGYMIDVGTFEEINTPYDWRVAPSFGPFDMEPNDVLHFFFGICMGGDLNDMRKNCDQMYADFLGPDGEPNTNDDWQVVAPPYSPRLVAVRGDSQITLRWNPNYATGKNTETDPDPRSGDRDFDGYIVWRSDIGFDSGWVPVLWIDKKSTSARAYYPWGWRVKTGPVEKHERIPDGPGGTGTDFSEPDLRTAPAVAYEDIKATFPVTTRQGNTLRVRKVAGYYEFVDGVDGNGTPTGELRNGTRYYYAVVAYDYGATQPFKATPAMGGRNINALAVIPLPLAASTLDNIRVVPNPYKGSADWEEWTGSGARLGKIYFMNVPPKCTIRIYTVAGDLVQTLEHNDVTYGAVPWDLTGKSRVQVASGIYFYHVDAPGIGEKVGKFAVLIGQN